VFDCVRPFSGLLLLLLPPCSASSSVRPTDLPLAQYRSIDPTTVAVGVPPPQPGQMGGAGAGYEELTPLVMQLSEPDKVRLDVNPQKNKSAKSV
jgi:hypothetical protein